MREQSKILLIDDDPYILDSLSVFLKSQGYGVESFSNAKSFIQSETDFGDISLVVCDMFIEDLTAESVLGRLTLNQGSESFDFRAPPPILLITSFPTSPEVEQIREVVRDVIPKPVDLKVLEQKIQDILLSS